jgi:hypothetical protein
LPLSSLLIFRNLVAAPDPAAQDLAITNARIIAGGEFSPASGARLFNI